MKTCNQCIYFESTKTIKDVGTCQAPVPYWVTVEFDACAFVPAGNKGIAPLCQMYTEEQVDVEELQQKNKELEDKLYIAKVQRDLDRHIVDGYDRG